MKKNIATITLLTLAISISSCSNRTCDMPDQSQKPTTPIDATVSKTVSFINAKGETLSVNYLTGEKAIIEFAGQKVELLRRVTASGVKFANADYEFSEWKNNISFSKNGVILFARNANEL